MLRATFATPDMTVFCRLDELGLVAVGQRLDSDRAVIECRVADPDPWCRGCGGQALSRGTGTRLLAHEPFGHRPTTLLVRVRRYKCAGCGRSWREDLTAAAPERAKLCRGGMRWALEGVVLDHLTMSRVAAGLGVSWRTANDAVLAEGHRLLVEDPGRFDGVRVVGVDEHVWRHTRFGDKYVTVIIDLTPVHEKTGPSRLLDMVEGRSKAVFKTWLAGRPQAWRDGVEVVAMDGFTGFKTAVSEELPDAVTVMHPFHVVSLAGDALDECRRRIQRDAFGRRGRKNDPLYKARRTFHTGAGLLTEKQQARGTVRQRATRRGRGDLGHLPAHGHRLPGTRPGAREVPHAVRDRLAEQWCPDRARRVATPRPHPEAARRRRPRVLRPPRHLERPHRGHQRPP